LDCLGADTTPGELAWRLFPGYLSAIYLNRATLRQFNTVRQVLSKTTFSDKRSLAYVRVVLSYFASLLAASCLVITFLAWDAGGRTSYEMIAVIERNDLVPESVPMKLILFWWVLSPLAAALVTSGNFVKRLQAKHALVFLSSVLYFGTVFAVSRISKDAPGVTVWVEIINYLSALGLLTSAGQTLIKVRN